MFVHIFKNSFIIDSPSYYIKSNYLNSLELIEETDTIRFLSRLAKYDEENKEPVFYQVKEFMMNPILQQYCYFMGLTYEDYQIMIEYGRFFENTYIKAYDPLLKNDFKPLTPREFSVVGQSIPWNYGVLPFEFWINHHKADSYGKKIYNEIYNQYKTMNFYEEKLKYIVPHDYIYDRSYGDRLKYELDIKSQKSYNEYLCHDIEDLINSDYNNMAWNSEFDKPLFNKRLMNHLRDTGFVLRNIAVDINAQERIDENKKQALKETPNYDNFSIYEDVPYDSSNFYAK